MDRDLSPRALAELLGERNVQLIDVREDHEREAGRIAGDRHIPLAELTAQAPTIDRERSVVFYCRSGARSAMASEAFAAAGYDAHNLAGGLLEWAAMGLPLMPEGGHVA